MHPRARASVPPDAVRPGTGERASGHGVSGTIAAVAHVQPLARDGIWRVTLAGEGVGRLVRRAEQACDGDWHLLRMDEVTDEQFDHYEAALSDALQAADDSPADTEPKA